ncbi:hypothetical protein JSY14_02810 [Brachybacterium sp. EF45031]|uniref:hypothetical protein n=1 Tax=Brachybacterium sillae TaxID=2810536 RepID=UPI00217D401A|nr:hypothetical protein [Brachybacterium sillae]MCS6710995.1 hypothetical protein [Brachybacterium sillae]
MSSHESVPVHTAPLTPRERRRRRLAAGLLGTEAVLVLVLATSALVRRAEAPAEVQGMLTALAVFLGVFALGLAFAVVSLLRRGRFGLGYGVTWQLFQALVCATMLSSGMLLTGAVGLALAIVTFTALLALVRATPLPYEDEDDDDGERATPPRASRGRGTGSQLPGATNPVS